MDASLRLFLHSGTQTKTHTLPIFVLACVATTCVTIFASHTDAYWHAPCKNLHCATWHYVLFRSRQVGGTRCEIASLIRFLASRFVMTAMKYCSHDRTYAPLKAPLPVSIANGFMLEVLANFLWTENLRFLLFQ